MSSLGPHIIRTTDAGRKWTMVAPIVKGLDNVGIFLSAPAASLRVFRHYMPNQDVNDGFGMAHAIIDALAGYRHPLLVCEIWNEVHPTAAQLKAAVDVLHGAGLLVAGGSYGTGDYVQTDIDRVTTAGCDYLALHAYWGNQGFTYWNALRYRSYVTSRPILITECGRDKIEGGKGGWKADGLSAADYADELLNYSVEIGKDAQVLGATPFTAGSTPDWANYDTDDCVPYLIEGETMPTVGTGYQKFILAPANLGEPLEDEVYHFQGTPEETSLAVFQNGKATWTKATNETIGVGNDGSIWRDGGNNVANAGKVVLAAGPFR